jgi:hypothetical protein
MVIVDHLAHPVCEEESSWVRSEPVGDHLWMIDEQRRPVGAAVAGSFLADRMRSARRGRSRPGLKSFELSV